MAKETTGPSTPRLFADAISQTAGLFQTEIRLVRTELSEKVNKVKLAAGFLAGAAILLMAALLILLEGVVAALVAGGMEPHWATFLVGGGGAVGLALLFIRVNELKASSLKPGRTLRQIGKDMAVAKDVVR